MKVFRLIELLEREDPDAEVVHLVDDRYYPIEQLVDRELIPTQIRNTYTNKLVPGYKEPRIPGEGKPCVEIQH